MTTHDKTECQHWAWIRISVRQIMFLSLVTHSMFLKEDINCSLNIQIFLLRVRALLSMDWVSSQLPCLSSMALSCCKIIFLSCRIPDFNNEIGECLSLTIPAALTVLAICDRSKDGRAARDGREIQSQHHRCCDQEHTTAPHNYHPHIKWWHTHCLSMLTMTDNS